MKCLFLVLSLILARPAYANKVADYYSLINEAELLLCAGKTAAALAHYGMAFGLGGEPFGKDVYNAWLAAYTINDSATFIRYSTVLIQRGAFLHAWSQEDFLSQVERGQKLKDYALLWNTLKQRVPVNIDSAYRAGLLQCREADEAVRKYFIDQCQGNYNTCGRDSLNAFDSLNVLTLKQMILEKGFPTESRVGFESCFPGNSPYYDIVLLHDRSWTNRQTLDTLLYRAVKAGKLHPQHYALLKDQSFGNFRDSVSGYQDQVNSCYGTTGINIIDGAMWLYTLKKRDTDKINAARADIFLEPIRDMYAKCVFQFHHPAYHLLDFKYFMILDGLPEQVSAKMIGKSYPQTGLNDFNTIGRRSCAFGLHH